MTRNDLLHEELIRLGNNKRLALDKVCVCERERDGERGREICNLSPT